MLKKRGLSLLLAFFMVLGMFAGLPMTASAGESIAPVSIGPEISTIPVSSKPAAFSDIDEHWAKPALEAAVINGLLSGWDGKIRPQNNLKRAEMAAIINRAFGTVEKASLSSFTDVPSDKWYYGDMAKAVKMGAFGGYAGKLNPEADITRQDAFVVLARALKLTTSDYSSLNKFSDDVRVASYAKPYIAALVAGGYIAGSGGKLNPEAYITRGEFAQVINNTIKGYIKAAGTYTEAAAGNLMVNMPGVTLKDLTVSGDLTIGDGVGTGEVTLDNVKVTGRMIVRGGGKNSVRIVNNSEIAGTVIVDNKNGEVRIYTDEGVTIQKLEAGEKVILEGNFKEVTVVGDGANVQVDGNVEKVVVSASEAKVEVTAGSTIAEIETTGEAAGTEIKVAQGATVSTVVAAAAGTTITGSGEVKVVEAKANDVTISTGNTTVMADSGVTGVTAGGNAVQGGTESRTGPIGTGSTTGGSSGGGSGSTVTVTAPSSAGVSVSKGSIDFNYSFYNDATTISYAQMLGVPYYLDLNASTVTIANDDPMQPFSSPAISLASLGITDGSSEFQDLDEMSTEMNYQVGAVGVGIPQKIKLSLKSKTIVDGKTVSNPWTYDTGWITFTPEELNVFNLYGAVKSVMVKDENGMPITGENLRNITGNLRLDTDDGMMGVGATIAWSSSNPSVIDTAGQVTFPVDTPANVTLTATVSYQGLSETIAFEVTVMAVNPSVADLSNIEITGGGTLSPAFSGSNTDYTVDLHNMSATCIGIKATVRSSVYRSLNFDGDSAASGAVYYKTLSVGVNIIPITVTAQDNTQKTYVLTVNRPAVTSAASTPGEFYLDGASDLDLYDDVRDLKITFFGAADESKIGEYRVLLARSVADFVYADALDSSCYVAVQPSGAPSYTATFSQGAKDVSGNPVVTGTEYYVAFLAA
ncbi:MAG: S-layer homology domain-containing protein, partial [Eubacteriales bacterium]